MYRSEIIQLLHLLRVRDLSESEWLRLHSFAEGDQFLLDALEGLRQTDHETRQARLQSILLRLSAQQQKKSIHFPVWIRVAAAVALVLTIGAVIYTFPWSDQQRTVASLPIEDEETEGGSSSADSSTQEYAYTEQVLESAEPQTAMKPQTEADLIPGGIGTVTSKRKQEDLAVANEEEAIETDESEAMPPVNEVHDGEYRARASTSMISTGAPSVLETEVRGVVMNNIGERLTGAQIQLKGTAVQTVTDDLGNFALDIPAKNTMNEVIITYAGYPSVQTNVAEGDSIIVRLPETVDANKASVTTLAQQNRPAASKPPTRSMAVPALGERSYNKYIRQNIQYPAAAAAARVHGKVVVEFDLDAEGKPQNLRIVRSLGYGCDEEAMRLIREGPAWNVRNAQVPMGRWEIEF